MRTALLDSVLELDLPAEVAALARPFLPVAAGAAATASAAVRLVAVDGGYRVVDGSSPGGAARTALSAPQAVELVLEVLNRTALEQCRDFASHAGAVARGGAVLALPGESGAGKTTLVAALLRAGWEYVSDEALVLDGDGDVRGYPKWLSLHRWTLERLELEPPPDGRVERPVAPQDLGPVAQAPLRLAHVLLVRRRPGPPHLQEAPRAEAAAELLRCGFNHYRDPAGSVARVSAAVARAQAWRLDLEDPVEAAELLSARLG